MDNKELSNTDVALIMKSALEFNASVLHLATAYYGNMDSKAAQKSLKANMDKIVDAYTKQLESIVDGTERNTDTST